MKKGLMNHKKSYVLISVLAIMMIMLVITYFLADALFSEVSIARNQEGATLAFNLAESGVSEAVWRIQNDLATRNTFLNTTNGQTIIPSKSLMSGGSYSVVIQNTAKAAATITATGLYNMGLKQAQRKTTLNVTQSTTPGTYPYDAALLVGGPSSGNIYIHNANVTHDSGYDPGSINSGGNIDFGNANIDVTKDILANLTITTQNSTVHYDGTEQSNYPTAFIMPGIDINSDNPNSYKSLAIAQNQYYTSAQFSQLIKTQTTFNGIVYIAGSGGVTLKNTNFTVNGVLVSEGAISVTNASLYINHTTGPSGLITLSSFSVTNANIKIDGLVYIGVQSAMSTNANITITGAILAHDFSVNNINLKLNFKKDWVSETLLGGGNAQTPVIQFKHWEEEY